MKKLSQIVLLTALSFLLGACMKNQETKAFIEDFEGVWYNEPFDYFAIIEDNMTITFLDAIALEAPQSLEGFEFPVNSQRTNWVDTEKSNSDNSEYVLESKEGDNTHAMRFYRSPVGTYITIGAVDSDTGNELHYLGEVDAFQTIAAPIYNPENRRYTPIDHAVYAKLQEDAKNLGISEVQHIVETGFNIFITDDAHEVSQAITAIMNGAGSDEDVQRWEQTKKKFTDLANEALKNDSWYDYYIYYNGEETEGPEKIFQFDSSTERVTDYLGHEFGKNESLN